MSASMEVNLRNFQVPNFVIQERLVPGLKQDGFKPVDGIPLKEVPESALAHLCDNFRAAVFEKAGKKDPGAP